MSESSINDELARESSGDVPTVIMRCVCACVCVYMCCYVYSVLCLCIEQRMLMHPRVFDYVCACSLSVSPRLCLSSGRKACVCDIRCVHFLTHTLFSLHFPSSYAVMLLYVSLALGRLFPLNRFVLLRTKFLLGLGAIGIVMLSLTASVGLCSLAGIKATLIIRSVTLA